ncbi:MAG: TrfA family protein [Candidatus Competibacter sp.]|nr:TrfA family protein [Candidatus Competibacter sp.]
MAPDDDLVARVLQIAERAKQRNRERAANAASTPRSSRSADIIHLPQWLEAVRVCPSSVLRSALFGVVRRGRRKALNGEVLATWEGVTIRYTGWRLDQGDLDVWLAALHLAREHNLGVRVPVTINKMLRTMGRSTAGSFHEWFKSSIRRLTACAVEITAGQKTFGGPLIEGFDRDESTGEHVLYLSPRLSVLFEDGDYTRIDWEVRRSLGMDLAKWLHGYIASHRAIEKNPHRIGLKRLQELCGSETDELRFFRRDVREAMEALQAASVVKAWRITSGDALEVVRPNRKRDIFDGEKPTG